MEYEKRFFYRLFETYNSLRYDLIQWREKYTKEEYCRKVGVNFIYGQFTLNVFWNVISDSFKTNLFGFPKKQYSSLIEANTYLLNSFTKTKIEKTQDILQDLLSENKSVIGGIDYSSIMVEIEKAKTGNNKMVEELEYTYIYQSLIRELIFVWASYGLSGHNKKKALQNTLEVSIEVNVNQFNTFNEVTKIFHPYPEIFLRNNYMSLPKLFVGKTIKVTNKQKTEGERYFNQGALDFEKGEYEKALQDFSIALTYNPLDVQSIFNRGYVYFKMGRMEEGRKDLKRSASMGDEDSHKLLIQNQ